MYKLKLNEIHLDKLLLDPNNYRFLEREDFVSCAEKRYHEDSVQDRALKRLIDDGLKSLKSSILINGFLPVERVVVRPYPFEESYFIVIEGNRRIASFKSIREDFRAGVDIPGGIREIFEAVPCLVADSVDNDPAFTESLMGIRHVGGIKAWGGYQRARLVAKLRDDHEMDPSEVSDRVGMSIQEVNRRYRAVKALQQMEDDEDFGEYADPKFYPLFHEAVSLPVVREWLYWSAAEHKFKNSESLQQFYSIITPQENDDGELNESKLKTYSDVRQLRGILPNTEAKAILLDPTKSLWDAIAISKQDESSSQWKSGLAAAISALKKIGALELRGISKPDLNELEKLRDLVTQLIDDHNKLTEGQ